MTAVPDPPDDTDEATELVDRTVRIDRGARPRPEPVPAADVEVEDTVTAVGTRRSPGEPVIAAGEGDDADDDTLRGAAQRDDAAAAPAPAAGPVRTPPDAASGPTPPLLRAAYSPDAASLRSAYAARSVPEAAPARAPRARRTPHAPADAQEVDRSVRARARRRLTVVVIAVGATVVLLAALLVAILVSSGA